MRGKQEAISGTTPIWISAVSLSSDGFAMERVEIVTSSVMKGKRREIRAGAHGGGVLVSCRVGEHEHCHNVWTLEGD